MSKLTQIVVGAGVAALLMTEAAYATPIYCIYRSFNPQVRLYEATVAPCVPPLAQPWVKQSSPLEGDQAWKCVCDWYTNAGQQLYVQAISSGQISCATYASMPRTWAC